MDGKDFTYSYKIERRDTRNFHGWVVIECTDWTEEEIYSTSSLQEAKAFMKDLGAN